jgi:lipoyl(octanoyl) transferase
VAFHGFSINISNNLNEYLKVKPCGLDNTKITSVFSEKKIVPKQFKNKLIKIFVKNIDKI